MSDKCDVQMGETRFRCDLEPGHMGQHRTYLDTVDEVVFFGAPLKEPSSRRLCKSCFGEINDRGLSVHGGEDIAYRLKVANERAK